MQDGQGAEPPDELLADLRQQADAIVVLIARTDRWILVRPAGLIALLVTGVIGFILSLVGLLSAYSTAKGHQYEYLTGCAAAVAATGLTIVGIRRRQRLLAVAFAVADAIAGLNELIDAHIEELSEKEDRLQPALLLLEDSAVSYHAALIDGGAVEEADAIAAEMIRLRKLTRRTDALSPASSRPSF